ncbi:hypothetical protein [Hyphococcus sp.]|uniref:hypothetical protein n=1 Tax=Hyphococcus sp. TaxID=2038636 RepID=UPI0035C6C495
MSLKERPLINAVERLGALPGFFFANMYVAGFFAIIMCPFFAAFFTMFWAATYGGNDTLAIFQTVHAGAWVGLGLGALFLLFAAGAQVFGDREDDDPEEKADHVKFLLGGVAGFVFFVVADMAAYDAMARYFAEAGPIACASVVCP